MENIKTDILVTGGGIAGCIAAISLVDKYRVTIVDKLVEPKDRIGESLAPGGSRILAMLGLDQALEALQGEAFKQNLGMQSYWGTDQVQIVDHMRNPNGYAKSLNRRAFEKFLREQAEKRGVRCVWGEKLFSQTKDDTWEINLLNEANALRKVEASFVIDATGRQSIFARSLGIKRQIKDKLVACWMTLPNETENTLSTISSGESGWWYSAVAPHNKRIMVFHTDSDLIEKQQLKSKEALVALAQRNAQMKSFLNDSENIDFKGTVAANSSKLDQVSGEGWAAIGDAAISFDPLSSQGMFNAMATAMQLRDLILEHGYTSRTEQLWMQQVNDIWKYYLGHRNTYYSAERRWTENEFWKRRQVDK